MHHHLGNIVSLIIALLCLTMAFLTPIFGKENAASKFMCTLVYVIMGLAYLAMGLYA